METAALALKMGTTCHVSGLLRKARALGIGGGAQLEALAVRRGCYHYQTGGEQSLPTVSPADFSNEELAIALISPVLPYEVRRIRMGAEMLGATGNSVSKIARLAVMERCVGVVGYIAGSGNRFEPGNTFWRDLLHLLPASSQIPEGVMPHPTRFVAMTGISGPGRGPATTWLRPQPGKV